MIEQRSTESATATPSPILNRMGGLRLTKATNSLMALLMMVLIGLSDTVVFAQEALRPPKTTDSLGAPTIVVTIIAVLLVAGVVFAVTLRSKRSHQD